MDLKFPSGRESLFGKRANPDKREPEGKISHEPWDQAYPDAAGK